MVTFFVVCLSDYNNIKAFIRDARMTLFLWSLYVPDIVAWIHLKAFEDHELLAVNHSERMTGTSIEFFKLRVIS